MRGDVEQEKQHKGEGLFRTLGIAMVIAGVIAFVAMFFCLRNKQGEATDLMAFYLPWVLPYGIVDLAIAGAGVFLTTNAKDKPTIYFPFGIIGIVAGSSILLSGIPLIAILGNVEFFISVLVIGACVGAIAITGLKALKDPD